MGAARQSDEERAVAVASAWVDRGELPGADLLLRQLLDEVPARADAYNLLGRIALAAGEPALAVRHFRRALEVDAYFKPASKNLRKAEPEAAAPVREGSDAWRRARAAAGSPAGYLVIRAWGYGFWSDVDHVMGNLLLAEITGRTPVIMWGSDSLWGGSREASAWNLYFEPVSAVGTKEAFSAGRVFPARWSLDNLDAPDPGKWQGPGSRRGGVLLINRPEEVVVADFIAPVAQMRYWLPADHPLRTADTAVVYRSLVERYLRPRAEVQVQIDEFCGRMVGGGRVLGVHFRGSDKAMELPILAEVNASYPAHIDAMVREDPGLRIFLITDSTPALEAFRGRYGGRVTAADCQRTGGAVGVHYLEGLPVDRRGLALEVMRDAYAAARCDRFLGLAFSNVSCMVRHLKDWPSGACTLLGPDLHLRPPLDAVVQL